MEARIVEFIRLLRVSWTLKRPVKHGSRHDRSPTIICRYGRRAGILAKKLTICIRGRLNIINFFWLLFSMRALFLELYIWHGIEDILITILRFGLKEIIISIEFEYFLFLYIKFFFLLLFYFIPIFYFRFHFFIKIVKYDLFYFNENYRKKGSYYTEFRQISL